MAESETCRLLIVTDDQIEVLRSLVNYAHQRRSWNDETIDADRYYLPDDDAWDVLEALVSDLEDKLMSQCDFVTLDDTNDRLGIGVAAPNSRLDVGAGAITLSEMTPPGGTPANMVVLFAKDDGTGKTALIAKFNSVSRVLATE